MVPAIAKLCYASHRKVYVLLSKHHRRIYDARSVIRACWALTKITKALQKVPVAGACCVSRRHSKFLTVCRHGQGLAPCTVRRSATE